MVAYKAMTHDRSRRMIGAAVAIGLTGIFISSSALAAPAKPGVRAVTPPAASTPAAPTTEDLEAQVRDLKQQLANLKAQQDDMLRMLGQLTDLANGKQPAPDPTPVIPVVPFLSVKGLPVEGPSNAKVVMVEFTDFECQYCGEFARNTYPQIFDNYIKYGKIRYIYHGMPLSIHPHAVQAAEAAQCAGDQGKFWEMHDSLFANQGALEERDFLGRAQALGMDVNKFSQCMLADKYADGLKAVESEWEKKGITGTPAFLIGTMQADGTVKVDYSISGATTYDVYQKDLDAELAKG